MVLDDSSGSAFSDDVSAEQVSDSNASSEGPFHSHGYALRVVLRMARDAALAALTHIDWEPDSADWGCFELKHSRRWVVRGATFVTHRKPLNKGLPMARFNRAWKTNLYSLVIEDDGEGIALTFHGVRRTDVEKVLCRKMGLGSDDYTIVHYTALERYFVLPPHEALRLAKAIGGEATSGRGRASRKRYLLKDYEVPIVVGKRARRVAKLTIYRLSAGATAQFKVELRLKGRSRDRAQFSEHDIGKLDSVLENLVRVHELYPVAKPARWEPVSPTAWRRDPRLAVISQKAYRGKAIDPKRIRLAQVCHTPCLEFRTGSPVGSLTCAGSEYIRSSRQDQPPSPTSVAPLDCARVHRAWRLLTEDIGRYPGYLTEVILSPDQDPAPFIEAVIAISGANDGVGVGTVVYADGDHSDSWGSVERLAACYPLTAETDIMVVVVDFSATMAIESAMLCSVGDSLTDVVPGPLYPPYWQQSWGLPPWEKALGPLMAPMFSELRDVAERTGLRIVTITTDLRPAHGRGKLVDTHCYRDARVRSHIGDAGRLYAHLRYLVDSDVDGRPTMITMAKDEGEGLTGRIIWG